MFKILLMMKKTNTVILPINMIFLKTPKGKKVVPEKIA